MGPLQRTRSRLDAASVQGASGRRRGLARSVAKNGRWRAILATTVTTAWFAASATASVAAQDSRATERPTADDATDARSASDPAVVRLGEEASAIPRPAPREVRIHVLDAQGRRWRPAESRGAIRRYEPDELFGEPVGLSTLQSTFDDPPVSPMDADGVAVVRVPSYGADLCFLDGDFGGRLYIDRSDLTTSTAFALCLHPLRRLRLRARTAGGDPVAPGRLYDAETASGSTILARRDPREVLRFGDRSILVGESDEDVAERLWTRGLVCPDVPLTVRTEFLGRRVRFEVPASCDVYEARFDGLGEVAFLTASHRRWMLHRPVIELVREPRSEALGFARRKPPACWIDREPIKDGCVGRRRAVMWPGRYRIGLGDEEPIEFDVRAGETVEVPLP